MRQKSNSVPASSETLVRNIRRATRKHHAAEEKIRIVLDGLRGETSIAELCRREGIAESMYYSWSKEFLEAQCGSSLRPRGASGLPAGCCGQASRTTPGWSWISVSSSLLEGYDEPEILRSSSRQFCLTGVEAAQPNHPA